MKEIVFESTNIQRLYRNEYPVTRENVNEKTIEACQYGEMTEQDMYIIKRSVLEGKKVLCVTYEADECYSDRTFEIHD